MVDDNDTERLLGRGNPGGPRLDRLWDQVAPAVVVDAPRDAWWRRMVLVLLPVVPVMAVVVFYVRTPDSPFTARSGSAVPPQLEATCGTPSSPCHVGQPVYLRLMARHSDGVVYVEMLGMGRPMLLGGPMRVSGTDSVAIPSQITPDADDVARGIDVRATWLPSPVGGSQVQGAIENAHDASSTLHLTVVP